MGTTCHVVSASEKPSPTSSPGPSASPTNDPGAGWTIARCDCTICSVKHCLWLVYSVVFLPRHTEKSNLHENEMSSLQLTHTTHTYAAVVLVWTFRQLCGWINMGEKCCQASEQLKASEKCAAKRHENVLSSRKGKTTSSIEKVTQNCFMREQQGPWKQFTEAAKRPNEFP